MNPILRLTKAKSPSVGHVPLGSTSFQTACRGTRTTRRQAPRNHKSQQPPPGGTTPTAMRTNFRSPLLMPLSPGRTFPSARHHLHQLPTSSSLSLGDLARPPGVVSILVQYWFWPGNLRIFHSRLPSIHTDQPLKPTIIALAPGGHPRATRRCMPF
ncbi:hypothetical protein DEO72_LG7g1345 [Vigna unguiculata]|uniref:Uncharacterized protein n=1 Tax=Vigna unguiculata TaxID=3917 RepID=A0A4D6MIM8_VIGUN|nr:hypothetical protein DEO72_LG7g1345 [Vigna unguiculata]